MLDERKEFGQGFDHVFFLDLGVCVRVCILLGEKERSNLVITRRGKTNPGYRILIY